MVARLPIDVFLDCIYEYLLMSNPNLDELLDVPLGVHPEATPEAKQRRAERFARAKAGDF